MKKIAATYLSVSRLASSASLHSADSSTQLSSPVTLPRNRIELPETMITHAKEKYSTAKKCVVGATGTAEVVAATLAIVDSDQRLFDIFAAIVLLTFLFFFLIRTKEMIVEAMCKKLRDHLAIPKSCEKCKDTTPELESLITWMTDRGWLSPNKLGIVEVIPEENNFCFDTMDKKFALLLSINKFSSLRLGIRKFLLELAQENFGVAAVNNLIRHGSFSAV